MRLMVTITNDVFASVFTIPPETVREIDGLGVLDELRQTLIVVAEHPEDWQVMPEKIRTLLNPHHTRLWRFRVLQKPEEAFVCEEPRRSYNKLRILGDLLPCSGPAFCSVRAHIIGIADNRGILVIDEDDLARLEADLHSHTTL